MSIRATVVVEHQIGLQMVGRDPEFSSRMAHLLFPTRIGSESWRKPLSSEEHKAVLADELQVAHQLVLDEYSDAVVCKFFGVDNPGKIEGSVWEWQEVKGFFKLYTKGIEAIVDNNVKPMVIDCPSCLQIVHLSVIEDSAEFEALTDGDGQSHKKESYDEWEDPQDYDIRFAEISIALRPDTCPHENCGASLAELELPSPLCHVTIESLVAAGQ